MDSAVTVEVIRRRLGPLWDVAEIDAGYRRVLRSTLSQLLTPAADGAERGDEESPLLLPLLCCRSLGDELQAAISINAAWVLLNAAFYLLDKVEDQEPVSALSPSPDTGVLVNATTGFMLGAELLLAGLEQEGVGADAAADIRAHFNRLALSVCAGQHCDLARQAPDLQETWQVAAAKSGTFFALGSYAGARVATGDEALLAAYSSFGRHLGLLIQIANDVDGLWSRDGCQSDLAREQWSLPIAYAFHVLPARKQAMLRTLMEGAAEDAQVEAAARRLILECGALIYLTLEMARRRRQAEQALLATNDHVQAVELLARLLRRHTILRAQTDEQE